MVSFSVFWNRETNIYTKMTYHNLKITCPFIKPASLHTQVYIFYMHGHETNSEISYMCQLSIYYKTNNIKLMSSYVFILVVKLMKISI